MTASTERPKQADFLMTGDGSEAEQLRQERAAAARKYQPENVRTLLVAEAPPAAPDRYFYFEDVAQHDALFRYVAKVVLGEVPPRDQKAGALAKLQRLGYFLIDLKLDPVDSSPLSAHVPDLINRATALKPRCVVLIKTSVYDAAFEPLHGAGLPVIGERIPFPGSGQQPWFEEAFARAIHTKPCG